VCVCVCEVFGVVVEAWSLLVQSTNEFRERATYNRGQGHAGSQVGKARAPHHGLRCLCVFPGDLAVSFR
jgi:hypothetical protein